VPFRKRNACFSNLFANMIKCNNTFGKDQNPLAFDGKTISYQSLETGFAKAAANSTEPIRL